MSPVARMPRFPVCFALCTASGCGTILDLLLPTQPTTPASNLDIMNLAEALVQKGYPAAVLIEAIGVPDGGTANTADDITRWLFRFVEDLSAPSSRTIELEYRNGKFDEPFCCKGALFGTVFERLPRDLSLAQALQKLRDAGFADPFTAVTLRKPLNFPIPEEHLYAFSLTTALVFVGATTGTVTTDTPLATPPPPNNIELMNQAEQIVEQAYPNALLIEAIGTPSAGTANTAADIDRWEFRFLDDTTAAPGTEGTVIIRATNGNFGDTQYIPSPLFGTIFERLPREMSLGQAIQKMRDAGYQQPFAQVVLRKPLTWPMPEEHLYIFSVPGKFVFVGAITGTVSEEIP